MSKNSNSTKNGVGFVGLLQVAFIVLKLCDVINWSWWLVCLPVIIEISFVVIILFIGIVAQVAKSISEKENTKKEETESTSELLNVLRNLNTEQTKEYKFKE